MLHNCGGSQMMSIKISTNDLEVISQLASAQNIAEWTRTISNRRISNKRDYYIYGREPIDAEFLQISISQVRQILSELPSSPIRDTILHVYKAGQLTNQQYVYLYGRSRSQDICERAIVQ